MLRFVLLHHVCPPAYHRPSHWDLMLERDTGALRTWALERPLSAGLPIAAEALADHRADYLDYEGPVSGDRGAVSRVDRGVYAMLSESAVDMVVQVHGAVFAGELQLRRDPSDAQRWFVEFKPACSTNG